MLSLKSLFTISFVLLLANALGPVCYEECANQKPIEVDYATLGGGCFWCMEAIYEKIPGVTDVESGYAGGDIPNPTYKQVKSGETGYAEVIRVAFDPRNITYEDLINAFFYAHDPTTLNRQGVDVGHQYRSVIYYHNQEQKNIAEKVSNLVKSKSVYENPIVTEIAPLKNYYPAEDYHQNYFKSFQENRFCTVDTADIAIKIEKFFAKFKEFTVHKECQDGDERANVEIDL